MKIKKLFSHHSTYQHSDPNEIGQLLTGSDQRDFLSGTYHSDTLFGYQGNDILRGQHGNDYIYAGEDNDIAFGGADDDMIFGEHGNDLLYGQRGNDHIDGGIGNDKLFAGFGNDYLNGGYDNDYLFGSFGNDWLVGHKGNDNLFGGSGCDTFAFTIHQTIDTLLTEGKDTIYGFNYRQDALSFSGSIKNLDDLNDVISNITHFGSYLKINFNDGNYLKIMGHLGWGKIHDVYELANRIDINFVSEYRNIDGSSNNLYDPYEPMNSTHLYRMAPADYGDGLNSPAGSTRPSAREVSNEIFDQATSVPNPFAASDFFWLWGQFIDHDIDLTLDDEIESFPIPVPLGDPFFDPFFTGNQTISLHRSAFDSSTGINSPREQINGITPFIDASMIYGSDDTRATYLRTPDGKLKVSDGDLLPFNHAGLNNAGGPSDTLFLAGDVRANENVALTSLHTLFVREHNRLVDELKAEHPEYTAEQLYQEAKMIVEAIIQSITYNEFLPLLLGSGALSAYAGYDSDINPQIANEFATAGFRLGHTLLSSEVERLLENGNVADSHLALRDAFFRPSLLQDEGQMENILRGVAMGLAESADSMMVDEVRNFLFGPPGAGGLDLASLNIQRGRDHGLADYNSVRDAYGLLKVTSFAEITSDVTMQNKLMSLYGNVDNIDLFVGGLVEDPLPGSMLGPLFQAIVVDQFTRLRDGDRFFYEDRFSPDKVAEIEAIKLSDVIERNTDIEVIQDNPFLSYNRIGGDNGDNLLNGTNGMDLLIGFDGLDILLGHDGNDELFGLGDNDTYTGGLGDDRFVSRPGDGIDTITDFNHSSDLNPENDKIDLTAHNTNFASLNIMQQGANTLVDINGTDMVALNNTNPLDITVNDFIFA